MQLASLAHTFLETSMKKNYAMCHILQRNFEASEFYAVNETNYRCHWSSIYELEITLTAAHTKWGLRVYHKSRSGAPPPECVADGGWRATERRFVARERRRRCPLPARAPTIQSISIWWKGFKLRQVCAWQNKRLHQPHLHARRCSTAHASYSHIQLTR